MDDGLGALVAVLVVDLALVVPVTQAGIALPGIGLDSIEDAALDIRSHAPLLIGGEIFSEKDDLIGSVSLKGEIVVIRSELQAGIAHGPEG